MDSAAFIEQLSSAVKQADAAFSNVRNAFHTASPGDRTRMLDVLSSFELKHQSHLAQFARAAGTAPSDLSTTATALHYRRFVATRVRCAQEHG